MKPNNQYNLADIGLGLGRTNSELQWAENIEDNSKRTKRYTVRRELSSQLLQHAHGRQQGAQRPLFQNNGRRRRRESLQLRLPESVRGDRAEEREPQKRNVAEPRDAQQRAPRRLSEDQRDFGNAELAQRRDAHHSGAQKGLRRRHQVSARAGAQHD